MSSPPLETLAVVLEAPGRIALQGLELTAPGPADVVVDITSSGISTGTERLLWSGRMPQFPGMGYPLVPGYESVGVVTAAGPASGRAVGDHVFVPGANCYGTVRGLFGGTSARVVLPGARTSVIPSALATNGILLALAATAHHAIHPTAGRGRPNTPDLIIGHGVLGRLLARLAVLGGATPTVWETDPIRRSGALGYAVVDPAADQRHDYRAIYDGSGDASLIDTLVQRLAPGGEIVLAGFYAAPIAFAFPPAFMREATFRIAAQWQPADLAAVIALAGSGALSLDGLLTHRAPAGAAAAAYETAFTDAACLKMVLDWRRPS